MSPTKEARGFLQVLLILGILIIVASVYSTVWATPGQQVASGGMVPTMPTLPTLPGQPGVKALATCAVSPATVTLQSGQTQQFTYTGRNIDNETLDPTTDLLSIAWSVVAGGGSINATSGLFTAGSSLGTFANTVKGSGSQTGGQTCEAFASVVVAAPPTATPTTTSTPTATPTITPTPTRTPTPTPVPVVVLTPAVIPAVGKANVEVSVKVEPKASDKAKGVTSTGVDVTVRSGETIKIEVVKDKPGKLVIPASVASGEKLDSFDDSETGVKLENNVLTVPLKDTEGDTSTVIEAKVKDVVGTGTTAEAEVEEIKLKTAEQKVNLSSADPDVGTTTSASLDVDLKSIPDGASLNVKVTKDPEPAANTAFTLAAQDAGTTIKNIAFTINVTKTNLEDVVGEARITMKVSETWVNKYGAGNVRIFRFSDTGEREVLETRIIGRDASGNFIFEGISPNGLSVFSLIALETAPPVSVPPGGAIKAMAPGVTTTLASPDEKVTVTVPSTAPVGTSYLLYAPKASADAPAMPPSGLAFGSAIFELKEVDLTGVTVPGSTFHTPITISVKYTAADLAAAQGNPTRLVLYQYDTTLKAWTRLSTTFDPVSKTIKTQVSRLSFFALLGLPQPPTPTPTPTPTRAPWLPTLTPTPVPPTATPTVTPVPPPAGDVAPGSGLLIGLLIVAAVLIAAGGYYLRQDRRQS